MSIMSDSGRAEHVTGKDKYFTYQIVESVLDTETGEPVDLLSKWKGCILDNEGKVIVKSREGYPMIGATFGTNGTYTLVTIPCRYLDTAERIRSYMYEEMDTQEKKVNHPQISSSVWTGESIKIQNPQTETQRLAQQQVSLNATKIAKLEEELKQLRITQKLLKGLR